MVAYRSAFLPILDNLIPHVVRLLAPDRPWPDHQWGICVFDDVIEFAGPDSVKYQELFLSPLLEYVKDKSPEVLFTYDHYYIYTYPYRNCAHM